MDSFEFNKVAGAVLMSVLIATVIGHIGDFLVPEAAEGELHIAIAGAPANAAPTQQASLPANVPIEERLAKADVQEGQATARQCLTCHTFAKGGAAKIGPDLYGVVGSKVASKEFQYSDAVKKLGGEWTFEQLDKWLTSPQKLAPGTKMTFAGIPDPQKRADVIAYVNAQSDAPLPLPKK